MIRTNQHRHNLDTRAHETLQPQRTRPTGPFEDLLRRQEEDEQHAKMQGEPSAEALVLAQTWSFDMHAAEPPAAASHAGGLDTPTPASAATAQAHLRMALPLVAQQAWTFDLSGANLPVQAVTLTRASNGQLSLSIQSSAGASGMQAESHLPKLRQRLADKVAHVDLCCGDSLVDEGDDGSALA